MDTDQLKEVVPHYIAMLLLIFGVLAIVQTAVGELSFWTELVIVIVIALMYRPLVMRFGIGPSAWER